MFTAGISYAFFNYIRGFKLPVGPMI